MLKIVISTNLILLSTYLIYPSNYADYCSNSSDKYIYSTNTAETVPSIFLVCDKLKIKIKNYNNKKTPTKKNNSAWPVVRQTVCRRESLGGRERESEKKNMRCSKSA